MPVSDVKVTLSAAVPIELKERIQKIATEKRWTLSQTVVIFIEDCLDKWEKDIGVVETAPTPISKKPKT